MNSSVFNEFDFPYPFLNSPLPPEMMDNTEEKKEMKGRDSNNMPENHIKSENNKNNESNKSNNESESTKKTDEHNNKTDKPTKKSKENKKPRPNKKGNNKDEIITEIPEVPATMEYKAPLDLEGPLGNAGLPRATAAPSKEVPKETPRETSKKSTLQQHLEFWDTDQDGVITMLDTWTGFRKLGFSVAYSAAAVAIIHFGFSYPTQKSWIPFLGNPFFNVYIDKIHKAKHGSDTESYDTEGRFVPQKFEETFSKYDRDNKGGLNFNDVVSVIQGNANAFDPYGWGAAMFEWGTLYVLCAKDGIIKKEDVRACYDGSLFFKMEKEKDNYEKSLGFTTVLAHKKEE